MDVKLIVYISLGVVLLVLFLLIYLSFHHKSYKYDLDRKPSESLYSKREAGTNGPFIMEYNSQDGESLNLNDIQIIDSTNILEFERDLEKYNDLDDDPDKAFMANLCEKMEYDLKEKIKNGHCICFRVPLRTRVIRDHEPSNDNSDELNLNVDDVVLLTKIFDDGWAFGSRAKGRFREGAFPICCLENRYDLFTLLPKRDNYDNLFNIDRYSSIRLGKNSTCQYYYHPVINSMKYFNTTNDNTKKITILDVDQLEKEKDICNCEVNEFKASKEPYNNKDNNNNFNTTENESDAKIPDLPKRPQPLSYEEKILLLRRSLERRQRKMQSSSQISIKSTDITSSDNNDNSESNTKNYV